MQRAIRITHMRQSSRGFPLELSFDISDRMQSSRLQPSCSYEQKFGTHMSLARSLKAEVVQHDDDREALPAAKKVRGALRHLRRILKLCSAPCVLVTRSQLPRAHNPNRPNAVYDLTITKPSKRCPTMMPLKRPQRRPQPYPSQPNSSPIVRRTLHM